MDYLFVYGLLRKQSESRMARYLTEHAEFLDSGLCPGRLYLVSHYPGMISSENSTACVVGDIYKLFAPDKILPVLDKFEGYSPGKEKDSTYIRTQRAVQTNDGTKLVAWVYLYNSSTKHLPFISSGDFLSYTS